MGFRVSDFGLLFIVFSSWLSIMGVISLNPREGDAVDASLFL